MSTTAPATAHYSAVKAIGLVTTREFRTIFAKKSMLWTVILMVLATIGAIVAADRFLLDGDDGPSADTIAVVGDAPFLAVAGPGAPGADQLPLTLEPEPAADEAAARAAVTDGDADAALIEGSTPGQWTLITGTNPKPALTQLVTTLAQEQARTEALTKAGVDPAAIAQATAGVSVTTDTAGRDDMDMGAIVTTLIGAMVLIIAVMMFGGTIGNSVVEEKSSRVVEIMLATVRPIHLLAGKILGAGLAGLATIVLVISSALATMYAVGWTEMLKLAGPALLSFIPFFIVGFFFYAGLYAAAGSLCSRMEDFQSAQLPVMFLAFVNIYAPAFGWQYLDSTIMRVFAWVPPFSSTVAPMEYAAGNMGLIELLGSLCLLLLGAIATMWLSGRIYPRNVLRMGSKVSWANALRR